MYSNGLEVSWAHNLHSSVAVNRFPLGGVEIEPGVRGVTMMDGQVLSRFRILLCLR